MSVPIPHGTEILRHLELSDTVRTALATAVAACGNEKILHTAAILCALAGIDVRGDWEHVWLQTGAHDVLNRPRAYLDPLPAPGHPACTYHGTLLSPATELAFRRLEMITAAYKMVPVPPGALALVLVADPGAGATLGLLAQGELSHEELLDLVESDILGVGLPELEDLLAQSQVTTQDSSDQEEQTEQNQLMAVLLQFSTIPSLRGAQRLVEQHHELLLSQSADAAMETFLQSARREGQDEIVAELRRRRHLLRRCRAIGITGTFEEARSTADSDDDEYDLPEDKSQLLTTIMQFVTAPTWEASKRVLVTHGELMSDTADSAFDVIIAGAETAQDGAADLLRLHQRLLRRCREIGIDPAFQELEESNGSREPSLPELIREFVTARTLAGATHKLEQHPALVSPTAVEFLERFIDTLHRQDRADLASGVRDRLTLLRRCVDVGITEAIREQRGNTPDERYLLELLSRAMGSGQQAESAEILREHPELLSAENDNTVNSLIAAARSHRNVDMATTLEHVKSFVAQCRALRNAPGTGSGSSRMDPEQLAILPIMFEFVRANSWAASRQVIEEHPELLSDAADQLCLRLIQAAELQNDQAATRSFTQHRRLLLRARNEGIPQAFNELGSGDDSPTVTTMMEMLRESQAEMEELGAPPEVRVSILGQAAMMFMERYQRSGATDAIDAAVECWRGAVQAADPEAAYYPLHLNNLSNSLTTRYAATKQLADLQEALDVSRRAVAADSPGLANRPGLLTNVGNVLTDLYAHTEERAYLDEAIVVYRSTVEMADERADNLPGLLANLSEGLRKRFDRDGGDGDLNESIDALRRAIAAATVDEPLLVHLNHNLAVSLGDRFDRHGDIADVDGGIAIYERTRPKVTTPEDLWAHLSGYGNCWRRRYRHAGDPLSLDQAITAYRGAAAATTNTHQLADSLMMLGRALRDRFALSGDLTDLNAAVGTYEEAVAAAPEHYAELANLSSALSAALSDRHDLTNAVADVEAALNAQERAVAATPRESPDWPGQLTVLGTRYRDRFRTNGLAEDLNTAIDWHERAVQATPAGSSELPQHLANWGVSLCNRYQRTGDAADLDRAVRAHARAVSEAGADSEHFADHLAGWATVLEIRYEQTGDLGDLKEAIDAFQQAAEAGEVGSHNHTVAVVGWGSSLRARYGITRERTNLEQAISLYEQVLAGTSTESPDRAGWLMNLANGLDDLYDLDKDNAVLNRAIRLYREALSLTGSRGRWGISVNLVNSLLKRADLDEKDIAECVARCEEAISNTAKDAPALPAFLGTLANALRRRGNEGDETAASTRYEQCCQLGLRVSPRNVLAAATLWGGWATERSQWDEAARAYEYGMTALAGMVGQQMSRSDKEAWLTGTQKFAAGLAYARTMIGSPEDAVVALERGRATLLAETLQRPTSEQSLAAIVEEAQAAPIVYIAAAAPGGVALIVRPDKTVSQVPLPELNYGALRARTLRHAQAYVEWLSGGELAQWDAELDDLGQWLWMTVMGNVLANLPAGTPELVLIACGYLGLLPLHAAWTGNSAARTGRWYALDEVRISYSANTRARQAARQMAADAIPDSVLIVEDPQPVHATPLAGAIGEAREVARLFTGSGPLRDSDPTELLRHGAATREAVKTALGRYNVLHLCCHGFANPSDPLRGGLLMAGDEVLTVQDIMRRRQTPARLAVLSACETAMPGAALPDEVVGLPTGLVEAGVAGVVGSLWAVQSSAAAAITKRFYRLWRTKGLEPAEALRQAQRQARDRSRIPRPSAWVAMTYTGA
ncbi:MAG: CHAT domain-containing protein [Pseudonocardiaceae bacterium]